MAALLFALLLLVCGPTSAQTVNILDGSKYLAREELERRARFLRSINASVLAFEGEGVPDEWLKLCDKYELSATVGYERGAPNLEEPCTSIPLPDRVLKYGGPTNVWRFASKDAARRGNALLNPDGGESVLSSRCALRWSAVKVLPKDGAGDTFVVYNNSGSVHLKDCRAECIYAENGLEKYRLSLGRLNINPGGSGEVRLKVPRTVFIDDTAAIRTWTFNFELCRKKPWANKGFVFARDQVAVFNDPPMEENRSGKLLTVNERADGFVVEGDGFAFVIGKRSGCIESWRVDGHERLLAPIVPDIGSVKGASKLDVAWRQAAGKYVVRPGEMRHDESGLCIIKVPIRYFLPDAVNAELKYVISPEGWLEIGFSFKDISRALMPARAGLRLRVSPALSDVEWLGRGPWEGMEAFLGRYRSKPGKMFNPMVELVEPIARRQVKSVVLWCGGQVNFEIRGRKFFSLLVLPASTDELRKINFPVLMERGEAWEILFDNEGDDGLLLRFRVK